MVTNQNTIDGAARNAFATRLSAAVDRAGHTRSSLARAIEVHPNRVGDWIAGRRWPHVQHVVLTAVELGVSTDWLLGSADSPDSPGTARSSDRLARRVTEQLAEIAPQMSRLARDAKRVAAQPRRR